MLSRSSRVAIVATAVMGCLGARISAQTPKVPLVIERVSIAPETRLSIAGQNVLTIDLYNNGPKTITARAYWIEVRLGAPGSMECHVRHPSCGEGST
jgi:hypothetical protein